MRKTLLLAAALVAGGCTPHDAQETAPRDVSIAPAPLAPEASNAQDSLVSPTPPPLTSKIDDTLVPDPFMKPPFPKPPSTDVAKVVTGNDAFAIDLYRQLATSKGNLFFSPASISIALAMTYGGARGDTAKQMQKALHFPFNDARLHDAFGQLLTDLSAKDAHGPELRVANRLFGQSGFTFDAAFLKLDQERYGAPLQQVDFATKTEDARRTINEWVAAQTHDKIPDLIGKGALTDQTRLVLTNAVYFKGAWRDQFDPKKTSDAPFVLADGASKTVPTMHQTLHAGYFENKDAQLVTLPYQSSDAQRVFSMTLVLPKPGVDLAQLEAHFDQLTTWMGATSNSEITLSLPRFKTTSKFALGDTLTKLGMPNAFDVALADFSGITKSEKTWLAQMVHQAFIATDENGTEAAAATAIAVAGGAPPQLEKHVFNANHPFSVVIRDQESGALLFMGRIVDPVS